MSRKPEILAEAAYRIFHKPKSFSGNFLIDDTFLAGEGVTDFDQYRVDPSQPLQVDFFVPDDMPAAAGSELEGKGLAVISRRNTLRYCAYALGGKILYNLWSVTDEQ